MTTQEALQLLADAAAHVSANRETHLKLIEAIKILEQALKPKEEK